MTLLSSRNLPLIREITSSISSFFGCPCARRLRLSIWSWMVDFRKWPWVMSKRPSRRSLSFTLPSRFGTSSTVLRIPSGGGPAFQGQTQDVRHAAPRHIHVKLDGAVAIAIVLEDGAAGGEVRGTEGGDNGLEDGVSIDAVHQHLEFRAHRAAVAGALQPEIRHVGFAARGDGIQFPFKASSRLQNAGHDGKNARSEERRGGH